ncbi:MAG: hypothetical protein WCR23_14270, partial [Planctomycetota bacterium]
RTALAITGSSSTIAICTEAFLRGGLEQCLEQRKRTYNGNSKESPKLIVGHSNHVCICPSSFLFVCFA